MRRGDRVINKIIKAIKSPKVAILYLLCLKFFRILPDKLYTKIKYRVIMGKSINFKNIKTFNEKMQWLKLYDRKPFYTTLVDKYQVRKYIEETIGGDYLIPLLGVYNDYEEIDFQALPKEFVLKPNHTSGDIYICHDNSMIDHDKLKKEIKKWLNRRYYWVHREWPYKNIKPKIICEKYITDGEGSDLKDYKFMCFNGKVKCAFVCSERNSEDGLKVDFYDMDWNIMPFTRRYPLSGNLTPKPKNFENMVQLAEKLSAGFTFLRVDFYEVMVQLFFGELTFYPGAGVEEFTPEEYDYVLGSWLDLPLDMKEKE